MCICILVNWLILLKFKYGITASGEQLFDKYCLIRNIQLLAFSSHPIASDPNKVKLTQSIHSFLLLKFESLLIVGR